MATYHWLDFSGESRPWGTQSCWFSHPPEDGSPENGWTEISPQYQASSLPTTDDDIVIYAEIPGGFCKPPSAGPTSALTIRSLDLSKSGGWAPSDKAENLTIYDTNPVTFGASGYWFNLGCNFGDAIPSLDFEGGGVYDGTSLGYGNFTLNGNWTFNGHADAAGIQVSKGSCVGPLGTAAAVTLRDNAENYNPANVNVSRVAAVEYCHDVKQFDIEEMTRGGFIRFLITDDRMDDNDYPKAEVMGYDVHNRGLGKFVGNFSDNKSNSTNSSTGALTAMAQSAAFWGVNGVPTGYAHRTASTYSYATDAAYQMRAALMGEPDNSVVLSMCGPVYCAKEFLATPANYGGDGISLTGIQIALLKLKRIHWGGGFWYKTGSMTNIRFAPAESASVLATWKASLNTIPLRFLGEDAMSLSPASVTHITFDNQKIYLGACPFDSSNPIYANWSSEWPVFGDGNVETYDEARFAAAWEVENGYYYFRESPRINPSINATNGDTSFTIEDTYDCRYLIGPDDPTEFRERLKSWFFSAAQGVRGKFVPAARVPRRPLAGNCEGEI